jgi:beta-N-acetylhexosaminidase
MNSARDQWVDERMGKMSVEQKIGQLLVFGFAGTVITPDVVEMVRRYHLGGLRISQAFRGMTLFNDVKPGTQPGEAVLRSLHYPEGLNRDFSVMKPASYCTLPQYAETLNRLRDIALERPLGIPIHFTVDQEGSGSDDLVFDTKLFPHPMGLAATGDPKMAYLAARHIGRQARAVGANMIHSPVLDVNTNPRNPEIGTRAYSDNPDTVTTYALETLRGFQETGLMATGKHFPGRGESMADAHWELPSVNLSKEELYAKHLAPYRALIRAGLPAIMTAHSLYPSLGVSKDPAGASAAFLRDVLRGELGFQGVITTDNMMMGGVLHHWELREAVLQYILAGNDLILLRDESPIRIRIVQYLLDAFKQKRLPEARLDESVHRVLRFRWDMGLARDGGKVNPAQAASVGIHDPDTCKAAREIAEKSVLLLRDRNRVMPVARDRKILVVEQVFPTHLAANTMECHPGLLWDEMCRLGTQVGSVEIQNTPTPADIDRVRRRLGEADVLVTTNYYYHKAAASITDLVREMMATGKPVIAVTNTPYDFAAPDDLPAVITVFNPGSRDHLRAAAEIIFGKLKPTARLPVKL